MIENKRDGCFRSSSVRCSPDRRSQHARIFSHKTKKHRNLSDLPQEQPVTTYADTLGSTGRSANSLLDDHIRDPDDPDYLSDLPQQPVTTYADKLRATGRSAQSLLGDHIRDPDGQDFPETALFEFDFWVSRVEKLVSLSATNQVEKADHRYNRLFREALFADQQCKATNEAKEELLRAIQELNFQRVDLFDFLNRLAEKYPNFLGFPKDDIGLNISEVGVQKSAGSILASSLAQQCQFRITHWWTVAWENRTGLRKQRMLQKNRDIDVCDELEPGEADHNVECSKRLKTIEEMFQMALDTASSNRERDASIFERFLAPQCVSTYLSLLEARDAREHALSKSKALRMNCTKLNSEIVQTQYELEKIKDECDEALEALYQKKRGHGRTIADLEESFQTEKDNAKMDLAFRPSILDKYFRGQLIRHKKIPSDNPGWHSAERWSTKLSSFRQKLMNSGGIDRTAATEEVRAFFVSLAEELRRTLAHTQHATLNDQV